MASKLSKSIYTLLSLIVFIVQYTDNIKEVVVKDSLHGGRRSDELCTILSLLYFCSLQISISLLISTDLLYILSWTSSYT